MNNSNSEKIKISPKYAIRLIKQIEDKIWKEFQSYKGVRAYIERWHEIDYYGNELNFQLINRENEPNIDLHSTLSSIYDDELLLKIAVDLGVETPDVIYSVPEIKGILTSGYDKVASTFENAYRKVLEEPATSVTCANSALESIISHICEDENITPCNPKDTLYKQTLHILKEFGLKPSDELFKEIKQIGSGLISISQALEDIRSKYSDTSHGKAREDYVLDDSLYSKFYLNAVTTVGLFLLNFYEAKYVSAERNNYLDNDVPF